MSGNPKTSRPLAKPRVARLLDQEHVDLAPAPASGEAFDPGALLTQAVCAKQTFTPAAFRWIRGALLAYVTAAGAQSLEECFSLQARRGERSVAWRFAEMKRTGALVSAWRLQTDCNHLSNWRRCEILASDLEDFDRDFWLAWQTNKVPEGASRYRRALYEAFAALRSPPPMTAAGLYQALKRGGELS